MGVKVKKNRQGKHCIVINHKGRRKEITIGTKAAAEKAKVKVEVAIGLDALGILKTAAPTFISVARDWLEEIKLTRARGTFTRYSGVLETKLKPLHKIPIDTVTRGDVRKVLSRLYTRGASKSGVELAHTVASGVFMYARDEEIVEVIPTQGMLKRMGMTRGKGEVTPFTADQIERVISSIGSRYRNIFEVSWHTGARIGELCALTWQDVNFHDQTIRISKTAKDQDIGETKTHVSREIDMSDRLCAMLINLKKKDKEICFKLGIAQNRVFHANGKMLSQNTLRRNLSRACEKLGLGHHTIHDIRHTTASVLLSRGVPLLYVSKLLGHKSPQMTLNQYSHYMPSENRGMVNVLDAKINTEYKGDGK